MATSATSEQRSLFCRMIDMGRDPQLCMKFMALWMWLERNYQEFEELVQKISDKSDEFITSVFEDTEAILASLDLCSVGTSNDSSSSPGTKNTLSLARRFLSISAVVGDKNKIYKAIVNVHNEICCVVFKDVLEERKLKASVIEDKKGNSAPSKLNPFAKAWIFATQRAPEEERSLFLTFSNGHPLTENQIFRFFQHKYGKCVERVYVHWPSEARKNNIWENPSARRSSEHLPALFGKVVFNKSSIPAMILCGHNKVKFFVENNKPLWCKKYEPNKTKSDHLASDSE